MATHELLDGEWIAVQARGGFEETVSEGLQQRGYGQFLPLYQQRRSRGIQTQMVDRPLFPGYVFCDISESALPNPCGARCHSTCGIRQRTHKYPRR